MILKCVYFKINLNFVVYVQYGPYINIAKGKLGISFQSHSFVTYLNCFQIDTIDC
jgi:hypothetical protein